jgi:hypothetical protein
VNLLTWQESTVILISPFCVNALSHPPQQSQTTVSPFLHQ